MKGGCLEILWFAVPYQAYQEKFVNPLQFILPTNRLDGFQKVRFDNNKLGNKIIEMIGLFKLQNQPSVRFFRDDVAASKKEGRFSSLE